MAMVNYKDITKFTKSSDAQLTAQLEILKLLIYHELFLTTKKEDEDILSIDIGIGTIYIQIEDGLHYKFIPAKDFEQHAIEALSSKDSVLIDYLSKIVDDSVYKKYLEEV